MVREELPRASVFQIVAFAAATTVAAIAAPGEPRVPRAVHAVTTALPSLVSGDSFTYATSATTIENGFEFSRTSTDVDTVAYPISYGANPTYRLTDSVTDTSDANASVSRIYFRFIPDAAFSDLIELGWDFSLTSPSEGTEIDEKTYGIPFYQRFQYPDRVTSWTVALPATIKLAQHFPDGSSISSYYKQQAGGAYFGSKSVIGSNSGTTAYVLRGDMSGSLSLPGSPSPGSYDFATPIELNQAYVIPVTLNGATTDVPDWYPGGGGLAATPQPLFSALETVTNIAAAPSICGTRAGYYAYLLTESTSTLDPIQGIYTTTVTQYYDSPAYGLICSVQNANEQIYDNLMTGQLGTTVATTTVSILTSETLGIGQGTRIAAIPRNPLLAPPGALDSIHRLARWRL